MICECGCQMEMVSDREIEIKDEGMIVEITYECPCCENTEIRFDA